tara:strand:+ start:1056 stop:1475 length:420 start_codon:yes stop_codon:yes gene_type:complete
MWKLIKRGAVLIGLLFLAQGCGANYYLDRAIAKDPKILDSIVLKVDTIIITQKEEIRDTLILQKIDTITLERNGIRIDLRRVYDTIEVDVQCPSDTIRISKEIKVPQLIYQDKNFDRKYLYLLIISIILYTFVLIKLLK